MPYYCGTVVNPTYTDVGPLTGTFVDACNNNESVFTEGGEIYVEYSNLQECLQAYLNINTSKCNPKDEEGNYIPFFLNLPKETDECSNMIYQGIGYGVFSPDINCDTTRVDEYVNDKGIRTAVCNSIITSYSGGYGLCTYTDGDFCSNPISTCKSNYLLNPTLDASNRYPSILNPELDKSNIYLSNRIPMNDGDGNAFFNALTSIYPSITKCDPIDKPCFSLTPTPSPPSPPTSSCCEKSKCKSSGKYCCSNFNNTCYPDSNDDTIDGFKKCMVYTSVAEKPQWCGKTFPTDPPTPMYKR